MKSLEEYFINLVVYSGGSVSLPDLYEMPMYMSQRLRKEVDTKLKDSAGVIALG